MKHLSLFTLKL
ncbi:rCG51011 [Rattus norvegicus]|uniref:RCG51011 n=1 Tax=Rattus norvegicus TaxID=10116 RepID=A6KGI2_RAT|nr:rCG51011 [Rattus norvegicus]